jgi:uncharacterized protein YbjQ (UPF0145 family)
MKMLGKAILLSAICLTPLPVEARGEQRSVPIRQALSSPLAKKLDPRIGLFFGRQKYPKVAKDFGEWRSNKNTNGFAKSGEEACERAFVGTLIALQKRAKKEGANAIVNISSDYENAETSNGSNYLCDAGLVIFGTSLKGRGVRLGGN